MPFFNMFVTGSNASRLKTTDTPPVDLEFLRKAKALLAQHLGLLERYLCSNSHSHDAIIYLLSPGRRAGLAQSEQGLASQIFYGAERLHPTAIAVQGVPIGFLSTNAVHEIAKYLAPISREQLHQHYDVSTMMNHYVYKMHDTDSEERFGYIWDDFDAIRRLYHATAEHNEAIITVLD